MKTQQLEKNLKPSKKSKSPDEIWLSSGSTLLNLAMSGRANGGLSKGHYIWFLGDSETGKSAFALQILAEAAKNPEFDKHRLIYDDIERGIFQFPIAKFYGRKLRSRIEPFAGTWDDPQPSVTVQEFYRRAYKQLSSGPCIIILDSMDALDEETEFGDFEEASSKDRSMKQSYGMGKAKENSKNIKRLVSVLAKYGSILIVVNQTRENTDRRGPYDAKTKPGAGGKALRFYAHCQIWTSLGKTLKKEAAGKDRVYGHQVTIAVKKNRISGWKGNVEVPFLRQIGFDDTGSIIDYLIEEGYWKKSKGLIAAKEFKASMNRKDLIKRIESKDYRLERLQSLVKDHWNRIELELIETRRNRYE